MSQYKYFMKIKKVGNIISDFGFVNLNNANETLPEDNDHFYWIEYTEVRNEVEEDSVKKIKWTVYVDDIEVGDLESMKVGAIFVPNSKKILPPTEFGDTDPNLFVFDIERNEWMPPRYSDGGVQVWDISTKTFVPVSNNS